MVDINKESLKLHKKYKGKLSVTPVFKIKDRHDLALAYTPGVAAVSKLIAENKDNIYDYTWRGRVIAVISDGSAVLGLGNIGPEAALPVMEGKSMLMKGFADVDSVPLVINTQESEEIIKFVKNVAPSFAGINLEDISAPRCFEVEDALQNIGIPVFHDDQHGTAIVVRAALINAAKVVGKKYSNLKVVVIGAGAAGIAVSKMLLGISGNGTKYEILDNIEKVRDLILVDTRGAIFPGRDFMNPYKSTIAKYSNKSNKKGSSLGIVEGADVIIGVSGPNLISAEMVAKMADKPIVFAMANPTPEIMPEDAKKAGAFIVATGRSDFDNQINNVLAFPGIFRAVIDGRLKKITMEMGISASNAIASLVEEPTVDNIIPDPFFPDLAKIVASHILRSK